MSNGVELLPTTSEQIPSPVGDGSKPPPLLSEYTAPEVEQGPLSMASEQMLLPVVSETEQEPVACGVRADAVVCGARDGAGAVA